MPPLDLSAPPVPPDGEPEMDLREMLSDSRLADMVPELHRDAAQTSSLRAIRDLQLEHDQLFERYIREKQELEDRFEKLFAPIVKQRKKHLDENPIRLFWYKAFENCEALRENITDRDGLALRYLTDVSCETVTMNKTIHRSTTEGLPVGSFVLTFRFEANPFFENEVLTKTYVMLEDDFEELDEARGTKIVWKAGKDLTVKTMRKKSKDGRVLIRKQPTDSFFNFFSPPSSLLNDDNEIDQDMLDEMEDIIDADFELGDTIRSEVIPRALLFYLNVAEQDEDSEDDGASTSTEDERGGGAGRTNAGLDLAAGLNGQGPRVCGNAMASRNDFEDEDESSEEEDKRMEMPTGARPPSQM
eukprot:GFKZ01015671.1.p1 GENE.GFKZ01015671.1~~GFKZ01015671.1.p1  ORF type:complete len:358 (-),score=75.07 GFKZ01015671.1:309-1382(-)